MPKEHLVAAGIIVIVAVFFPFLLPGRSPNSLAEQSAAVSNVGADMPQVRMP